MRSWPSAASRPCVAVLAVMFACTGTGTAADDDGGEGTSGGELPAPRFIEPAGGRSQLPVTRTEDVRLDVANVRPGATVVRLDGTTLGTMVEDGPVGQLKADELVLHLRGAMVPGGHTLQLRDPASGEAAQSKVVEIALQAATGPELAWRLDPAPVDEAIALGTGTEGALWALKSPAQALADPPVLTVWGPGPVGWAEDEAVSLSLPGLVLPVPGAPAALAVAGGTNSDVAVDMPGRVAWRVGNPGIRIDLREFGGSLAEPTEPRTVLLADSAWVGSAEWVALGQPWLLGDLVLAEVFAPVDTEHPRLADHGLGLVRLPRSGALGTPTRVPLDPAGVDQTSLVFRVEPPGTVQSLGVRLGGRRLAVVDVDRFDGSIYLQPASTSDQTDGWLDLLFPPVRVLGALGSHTAVGVVQPPGAESPGLRVLQRRVGGPAQEQRLQLDMPAGSIVAQAPSVTVIAGAAVVLVPRVDADVLAVQLSGEPTVEVLTGLACDALALRQRVPEPDGAARATDADVVGLACLRAGELWLGVLGPA